MTIIPSGQNHVFVFLLILNASCGSQLVEEELEGDSPTLCESLNGTAGVCVSVKKHLRFCAPLLQIYDNRKWDELRDHFCVPRGSRIAKVCCPLDEYKKVPAQGVEPEFRHHRSFLLLPFKNCGTAYGVGDRIIGGKTAAPGHFPWMARLGFRDPAGRGLYYLCGGTIINERYILTAAHCFKNREFTLSVVRLADTDESKREECIVDCDGKYCSDAPNNGIVACSKAVDYEPEDVTIHPGYQFETGSVDDIALIRLKRNINITNWFTRPICLPFVDAFNIKMELEDAKLVHKKGIVAGWGLISNYASRGSVTLQYVSVPMIPLIQCQLVHRSNTIQRTQLCAGGVKDQDTCLGDSGSPLTAQAQTQSDWEGRVQRVVRNFQLGIVSYGRAECGLGDVPVVYTRVRSYLQWILDTLKP